MEDATEEESKEMVGQKESHALPRKGVVESRFIIDEYLYLRVSDYIYEDVVEDLVNEILDTVKKETPIYWASRNKNLLSWKISNPMNIKRAIISF